MNILILDWGGFTQADINDVLSLHHVKYRVVNYCFGDVLCDDFFVSKFTQYVNSDSYGAVFTVNFHPLVAEVCYRNSLPYLSWSYDSPLIADEIEGALSLPTNYVFLFDRIQAEGYQNRGYKNIYHLPLGIHPRRLDKIIPTKEDMLRFSSEISFVGKFYNSTLPDLLYPLNEYTKGYIKALTEVQFRIYGSDILSEVLSTAFMEDINQQYKDNLPAPAISLTTEQLAYSIDTYITRRERLVMMHLLSKHHEFNLYSREKISAGEKLHCRGSAGYFSDMPRIFKLSKINLNITLRTIRSGIPLRALDILGCGGLLFSNYQPELWEHFTPGTDYIQYDSPEDAAEKADFYLAHEEIRQAVAKNGYHKAVENFNYSDRLMTMFQIAGLQS